MSLVYLPYSLHEFSNPKIVCTHWDSLPNQRFFESGFLSSYNASPWSFSKMYSHLTKHHQQKLVIKEASHTLWKFTFFVLRFLFFWTKHYKFNSSHLSFMELRKWKIDSQCKCSVLLGKQVEGKQCEWKIKSFQLNSLWTSFRQTLKVDIGKALDFTILELACFPKFYQALLILSQYPHQLKVSLQ